VKRILIVDDNAIMRRQIRRILEAQCGVEICGEAVDGTEALRKIVECRPDLVVLDFMMPGMNGLQATREIKRRSPNLQVLLFTLNKSAEIDREGRSAGADAVLPKVEGSSQLASVVVRLLNAQSRAAV
jgi:DNA-binding NarL/FixJ family response regulator